MTMTDPIADMLTRLRNANTAMHDDVKMPSSSRRRPSRRSSSARATSARTPSRTSPVLPSASSASSSSIARAQRAISGIQRVSKPGLRVYSKYTEVPVSWRPGHLCSVDIAVS